MNGNWLWATSPIHLVLHILHKEPVSKNDMWKAMQENIYRKWGTSNTPWFQVVYSVAANLYEAERRDVLKVEKAFFQKKW
jgi:hypothetical protein